MGADEKNETDDLLSRRMSSRSGAEPSATSATGDPVTDTEAFAPITDAPTMESPKPSTGPVRVTPAHSANPGTTGVVTREIAPSVGSPVMSEADWATVTAAATSGPQTPTVPEKRTNALDVIGIVWIGLATPFILLAVAIRLIASGLFLKFEYFRPGFPADQFGFSNGDREHYGSYVIDYLYNLDSRRYLADVIMPNGEPIFISDELNHMADVKSLFSLLFLIAAIGFIGAVVFGLYLSRKSGPGLHLGVRLGSIFSIIAMAGVTVLALLGWENFFRGFHKIFFANGTWEFYVDDSLIRLFPPQFWVDAGIGVGGCFALLAIILFASSFAGGKKRRAARRARKAAAAR